MAYPPELYIFGGLPASGKSTLAMSLAKAIGAVYIRVDSIEEAIIANGKLSGPEGYEAAYSLTRDNLEIGLSVVADSVNPVEITRAAWRQIAKARGVNYHEIEVICSDKVEHRQRLEARESRCRITRVLTWEDVVNREYEPWARCQVFDTAGKSPEENSQRFLSQLNTLRDGV